MDASSQKINQQTTDQMPGLASDLRDPLAPARSLLSSGRPLEAKAKFLELLEQPHTNSQILRIYSHLICITSETRDFEQIQKYIEKVNLIQPNSREEELQFGQCLRWAGIGWYYAGNYKKAREYLERSRDLGQRINDDVLVLESEISLANVFLGEGAYQRAFDDCARIETEIQKCAAASFLLPFLHVIRGNVHRKLGHFQHAIDEYERARLLIVNRNSHEYHYCLWALGTCYAALEDKEKAKIYLELASNSQAGSEFWRINVLSKMTLAKLYTAVGDFHEAHKVFQQIEKLVGSDETSYYGKRLLGALALLAIREGQYDRANEHIDRLVVVAAKNNDTRELMKLRLLKAEVLLRSEEVSAHEEARTMLDEALAFYREAKVPRHQAVCLDLLARLDSYAGYPKDALKKISEMIELARAGSFERLALRGELAKLVLERKLGINISPDKINQLFIKINRLNAVAEKTILSRFTTPNYDDWMTMLQRINPEHQRFVNEFFEDFHFVPNQTIDLEIDSNSHYVREKHLGEIPFHNKFTLMKILLLLAQSPGREYSKEELANLIWEQDYNPLRHDNNIYININRLRKLIEPNPRESRYIMNGSRGYYFNPEMKVNISTKIAQTAPRLVSTKPDLQEGV